MSATGWQICVAGHPPIMTFGRGSTKERAEHFAEQIRRTRAGETVVVLPLELPEARSVDPIQTIFGEM